MEITDVTNKRNTIDDIIIEEEFIEEKEYTEEEQMRMGYASAYPEDYVDDTITINAFYLGEMDVNEHKPKRMVENITVANVYYNATMMLKK